MVVCARDLTMQEATEDCKGLRTAWARSQVQASQVHTVRPCVKIKSKKQANKNKEKQQSSNDQSFFS